jgi:two-component system chemotaxis response regulator CheY
VNISVVPGKPFRRPRWMIVDDDREMLRLLERITARLTLAEIECHCASQDAFAAFEALPSAYEFVITDLEMPELDGLELCHRLRALSPELKILLVTGGGSRKRTRADFVAAGFCAIMEKPFTIPALEKALAAAGVVKPAIHLGGSPPISLPG